MAQETLSTELGYASLSKNTADEPTPVAEWDVPEGTKLVLRQGHPAILDVEANGGGDLPRASRIGLAYKEPNDPLDAYTVISDVSIAPFNPLSLKDQQSGDNAQRRRVRFNPDRVPGGEITLSDSDTLALFLNSGSQVDETTLFFNYPMQVRQE